MSNILKFPEPPEDDTLSVDELAAADWMLRSQRGFTRAEEMEFADWLVGGPSREQLYGQMRETARLLDQVAPAVASKRSTARSRWLMAVGAAAVVAVSAIGWWQFGPMGKRFIQVANTEVGANRQVMLPDGSVAQLNTDTQVEFAFDGAVRRVHLLRGEAYFTVAKDASRPFWVQAGPVAVRAVGTAFNVRLASDQVNVVVTEGIVRVVDNDETMPLPSATAELTGPTLTVGQVAQVHLQSSGEMVDRSLAKVEIASLEPRALRSALAWQEGRLEFLETPLAEVVAEFNRYNQRQVTIEDPVLAARRFGGSFSSHQVEALVEVLEQSFGVVSQTRGNQIVLRRVP